MQETNVIWLSDDDADDREMICESLAQCSVNLRVDCFESGAHVLEKLSAIPPPSFPHVIILDHHMPGTSGLDVLTKIKSNEATSHIPVILISGRVSETEIKLLTQQGANFVINKPNSFTELQTISESICKLWLHN